MNPTSLDLNAAAAAPAHASPRQRLVPSRTSLLLALAIVSLASLPALRSEVLPLPFVVPAKVADQQQFEEPERVALHGYLGSRIDANAHGRLMAVDENRMLEGYRKRPGRQTWDGEHVGKWLDAATLAWANDHDPALRAKLDRVVSELVACQQEDGYLGTYLPDLRWKKWDVWAHKYNLIGLLTYVRYTGNRAPLAACRRMADLLCHDIGDGPGQRSILQDSPHFGMAHSSVLKPMVLLYRMTGEPRYLDFARYILRAWDAPGGPRIVSDLLAGKGVDQIANAKAYEMLSCLNGVLELYRVTGDEKLLTAARNAWTDIATKRLYITGTTSHHEHFHADYELPNGLQDVAETCVTVTWLQFTSQLLRLTGGVEYAQELERTCYNQLLGAQQPDGLGWGYYVQLEAAQKPFACDLTGNCCLSSGPRGVALIPTFAVAADAEGPVVNLYDPGTARLTLPGGRAVNLAIDTKYPVGESVRITVSPASPAEFTLKLRIPTWANEASIAIGGTTEHPQPGDYASVTRTWRPGDVVTLTLPLKPRLVIGDHGNTGLAAILYGPLVLAADDRINTAKIGTFQIPKRTVDALHFAVEAESLGNPAWTGGKVFSITARTVLPVAQGADRDVRVRLLPFAEAGYNGAYKTWLPVALSEIPPEAPLGQGDPRS